MAGEVAALYNRLVEGVPHCYPVGEREFSAALELAARPVPPQRLHSQSAFVAREGGNLVGFSHAAVGPLEQWPERGSIRFLGYERGHRRAGQALLEAAEAYLSDQGMERFDAFEREDRYRFYHVLYGYLSEHLEHVHALLRFNGYTVRHGEVVLDWPDYKPPVPVPPGIEVKTVLEWRPGRGRLPGLKVGALVNGEEIGQCVCVSCGEMSDADAAQDWLFVDGLFIDEPYQGRGLGRYLLQRAMLEMHGTGYRHASISTEWTNHRALLFYSNFGFRRVDWTHLLARGPDLERLPKGSVE
jgi:GNAT superfamily N-acetyltransferase